MRKVKVFLTITLFLGGLWAGRLSGYASYRELAEHYAPVIYQEVYPDSTGAFDRITSVDFDGDFDPTNNIQNALNDNGQLPAAVYYFVIESKTHFFIYYFLYHVWTNEGGLSPYSHEFDGIMVVVYKDGSTYGDFTALEIMTNNRVSVYKEQQGNDIESGSLNISGGLDFYDDSYSAAGMYGNHPVLFASYAHDGKGHDLRNWLEGIKTESLHMLTYYFDPNATDFTAPAAGDESISNDDLGGDINNLNPVPYELIDITSSRGIWELQFSHPEMFDSTDNYYGYILGWPGNFGKTLKSALYNGNYLPGEVLPWFFDDYGDSSSVLRGDWFFDPTRAFNAHVIVNQDYSFYYGDSRTGAPGHPLLVLNGMYLNENSPNITSYPPRSVQLGNNYIYDVQAEGSGTLHYGLLYAPDGMSIDSGSGYIQWHPPKTGLYHVIVEVDNGSSFMLQHFTINVTAPPPPGSHSGGGGGCDMSGNGNILPGFLLMILLPFFYKKLRYQKERG